MDFLQKLLNYYHIDSEGYALLSRPFSFSLLPSISSFPSVTKAIERLKLAKERKERVLIYGDYDCDGVMASSIMKLALNEFGVSSEAYLPSRYLDGYGLNEENVKKMVGSYSLIITVDNGVTANASINLAYENNIDVIVLDHHSYEVEPEHIVSLIHPLTVGLSSPSVSAGFLSYLFSVALLNREDPYLEMLGATSLVSDAMDIISYNRLAVGLALKLWNEKGNLAFDRLLKGEVKNENALSLQIIPAINSIGRMNVGTKINRLIKYFTSPETKESELIAAWMLDKNQERKDLISSLAGSIELNDEKSSITYKSELPEGMNGLLASKIIDKVKKPVAVYSQSEKDENRLVGSIRSKAGCPLTEFMSDISDILLAGGGHSYAAGFSIKKDDIKDFESRFDQYSSSHPFIEENNETIEVSLEEINRDNYDILSGFSPFGKGYKAPLFSLKIDAEEIKFSPDGKRIQTYLSPNVRLFSFKFKKEDVPEFNEVTLIFEMNLNVFKGKETVSADIIELRF